MDETLISSLLRGDNVVQEVITTYIPLAKSVARKHTVARGSHYEDICSAVFVSLAQAVNRLCGKADIEIEKVESFLLAAMHGGAYRYNHTIHLIKVPEGEMQRRLKSDEPEGRDSIQSVTTDEGSQKEIPSGRYTAEQEVDYKDRLAFIARTEQEKEVLNLLIQGWTQAEIARHLDTYPVAIGRVVDRIRKRWKEYG